MANDAHINFVGTVLQDPTNRQVNGNTVLGLRVAVQTTKRQEGSQYPASDIYDVSVWGKQAESLMEGGVEGLCQWRLYAWRALDGSPE